MLGILNSNIDWRHLLKGRRRKNETVQRTISDLSIDYPELKTAGRVWDEVLAPKLTALETKRHNFIWAAIGCALAFPALVCAHIFVPAFTAALPGLPFVFYAAAIGGAVWSFVQAHKVTETAHRVIAPAASAIFNFSFDPVTDDTALKARKRFLRRARSGDGNLDGLYNPHKEQFPKLASAYERLMAYHILADHSYAEFEDIIIGKRNGGGVRSFECRLIERQKKRSFDDDKDDRITVRTHFAHIVQTQIKKRFAGRTIIRRKSKSVLAGAETALQKKVGAIGEKLAGSLRDKGGMFGKILGNAVEKSAGAMGDMQAIKLESSAFAKQFEAFGTDQVEARFILTPDVMDALTQLSQRYHAQEIGIVFENNSATLCLHASDKFEPQSCLVPLDQKSRFIQFVNDLAVIMDLVDTLRGKNWTGEQSGETWVVRQDTKQRLSQAG